MAFYPDELSPIDRIRSLGKQTDSLPEIGSIKNRRQWKSLVLGKKDLGMNSFATIKEEKEEEMSSDGSQGANSNKSNPGAVSVGSVTQKRITFPKPRKYITSRVTDRKEDLRNIDDTVLLTSLNSETSIPGNEIKKGDIPLTSEGSKTNIPDTKQPAKPGKSKEFINITQDYVQNYALSETPLESQWNDTFSENIGLLSWGKPIPEKTIVTKFESTQGLKPKQEEKKKISEVSRAITAAGSTRKESKEGKKKTGAAEKKATKKKQENLTTSVTKPKAEKGKTLNMKEVVNVYKNLAYGSKEEIKTFVENLSYVKDESEMDKNVLSMKNLKVLENKIKKIAKNTDKGQEPSTSKEKKPKQEKKIGKKINRNAHIERLARHKVVKVPAVLSKHHIKTSKDSTDSVKPNEKKESKSSIKNKEPWKYVGMESALNKTYFVYPAYPPPVNLKKSKNKKSTKRVEKGNASAPKSSELEPKVKAPQVVLRPNTIPGGGLRSLGSNVTASASGKCTNRPSATTVCTVEFRPDVGHRMEEQPFGAANQSLLVYLHGTKAIHVKSPYSGNQFSRVKLFRKDERGMPLVKGIGQKGAPKGSTRVAVQNVSLPGKLNRVRSLDLLSFDEDIQNITEFLRSQESPVRERQEGWQRTKKVERESRPKETPEEQDAATFRRHRRQRRTPQDLSNLNHLHLPHQHGTHQENLSPDSIMNEISKNIRHFQYLPDTEDNRKMIGQFFDELDQQIEASKKGALAFRKFQPPPGPDNFRPIPILGY